MTSTLASAKRRYIQMYVKVPKDINEYEGKVLKGLSLRSVLFGGIAILTGVLVAWLGSLIRAPGTVVSFAVMLVTIPIFLIGFIRIGGIPADRWMAYAIDYMRYSKTCLYDMEKGGKAIGKKTKARGKRKQKIPEGEG